MRCTLRRAVVGCLVAAAALLAGCPVPIPPLGYEPTSRGNVPASRPEWIVEGQTTLDDVLLRLGTPDAEAWDLRWIGYSNTRHEGGILLLAAPGLEFEFDTYTTRRLVVWFDTDKTVSRIELDEKRCPSNSMEDLNTAPSEHCLGFAEFDSLETVFATFDEMDWSTPFFEFGAFLPPDFKAYRGRVVVTERALVASGKRFGAYEFAKIRLPFEDVKDIAHHTSNPIGGLVVTMKDGITYEFVANKQVPGGDGGPERTRRLIRIVEERLQTVARPR